MEKELLVRINELGIGPAGFGGKTTALAVNIDYYPTHIAGLPVSINISCHASRHAHVILLQRGEYEINKSYHTS